MDDLFVYTVFDNKTGKPRCTGVKNQDKVTICDIFRPGAGKTIKSIDKIRKTIKELFLKAESSNRRIITSDFKSHIKYFDLPRDKRTYNVYDMHLPDIAPTDSRSKDHMIVAKILDKLSVKQPLPYHNILALAAVAYQFLEENGIQVNGLYEYPKWSQKTFSGRSKSSGFNIQGLSENYHVASAGGNDCDVLLMFDWICADIRAASILAEDPVLEATFTDTDPYTHMMETINKESEEAITRSESKQYLLKSINSMDLSSVALTNVFPKLGGWISKCRSIISNGKPLSTLLGRTFRPAHAKNDLAVLNGIMQGSVAHAMQNTLRKVWEKLPDNIVCEIHDCLIISAPPDPQQIKAIINVIVPIMTRPFEGLLHDNPFFPINVSIGDKWKMWKKYKTYRSNHEQ